MSYCTLNELKKIVPEQDLIQLSDDRTPPIEIVAANVERAIEDAGETIDGYLRGRYDLPLSPLPGLIGTLAADIAVYRLYARRATINPTEGVAERYKNALDILKQIQKGLIKLGAGAAANSEASSDTADIRAGDRVFTRDKMRGY